MAAIHIDLVFGEHNRKEEDKPTERTLEEKALMVDMEIPADEPLNDDDLQEGQRCSGCSEEK